MARFFNRRENPNALAGLFLLILLAVFAGPTVLPELIATAVPFVDEGVPCGRLRDGSDRAQHQSLLGREVSSDPTDAPISLIARGEGINADSSITVSIVVTNDTLGTVPIVISEGGLISAAGDGRNGFGVLFGDTVVSAATETLNTYPANRIRLLAPRQRCVYRATIAANAVPNPSVLVAENVTLTAFYRNNSQGQIPFVAGNVYQDQGLWVGVTQSAQALLNNS